MPVRHPSRRAKAIPTRWLMTDERIGESLWAAVAALPRGSGIVFRHFATAAGERAVILARLQRVARRRALIVVEAGAARQPLCIHPAHSAVEAVAAQRNRAGLIFVSPVYATRTHPGARPLGPLRAALIARRVKVPAIALGGMTEARFKRLRKLGFVGWAAIDGLTPGQKRKAVPM